MKDLKQYTDSWGLLGTIEGATINGSDSCYYTLLNQYCRLQTGAKIEAGENRHLLNCFWDKDAGQYVSHPDPVQNWGDGANFTLKELTILICFVLTAKDLRHKQNLLTAMQKHWWLGFWGNKKLISASNALCLMRTHWAFYPLLLVLDVWLVALSLHYKDAPTAIMLHYSRIQRPTIWSMLAYKLYKFEPQEFMPKHTPPLEMPVKRLLRSIK